MLKNILNGIAGIICFTFGHQVSKKVFTGKTAYVYDHSIRANVLKPVIERQRVGFCLRCGKQLGPITPKKEEFKNL
jgi:hypothetical protein